MKKADYELRELCENDYDGGYIMCLSELTKTGNISKEDYIGRLNFLREKKDYKIIVAIDKEDGRVIGAGTLFIEYKFIRECACKGHIEDLVVLESFRGSGVGKAIVMKLLEISASLGCYKTALVCNHKNIGFYNKCGFDVKEHEMVIYHEN